LQRKKVARLLDELERDRPGTKRIMLSALHNARPTHLLDQHLWRALGLGDAVDDSADGEERKTLSSESLLRD
jgi:hypothetical protein